MEIKIEPKISQLEDRQVAYVSYVGNYMGNPQIFKDLFDKLLGWAGMQGIIDASTVFLASYQDDPKTTPPEKLKLELCMTIADDVNASGEIQKKVLPGGIYVTMQVELAGLSEYGPAWNEVVLWMQKNGYAVDMSRPSYEIYLNNPEEHPEKHHIIEICMSAKKGGMDFCASCTMPLTKPEEIGTMIGDEKFCVHCVNADGTVKSCTEIFEGGVQFFLSQFPDLGKEMAEKITRKNMSSLEYWQDKKEDCLKGEVASDEEFQAVLKRLHE